MRQRGAAVHVLLNVISYNHTLCHSRHASADQFSRPCGLAPHTHPFLSLLHMCPSPSFLPIHPLRLDSPFTLPSRVAWFACQSILFRLFNPSTPSCLSRPLSCPLLPFLPSHPLLPAGPTRLLPCFHPRSSLPAFPAHPPPLSLLFAHPPLPFLHIPPSPPSFCTALLAGTPTSSS